MMINNLPSQNLEKLKSLIGKKITDVKRWLFTDDKDREDYQQNADGPTQVRLSDNTVLHFTAISEVNSVGINDGEMPVYGSSYELINVTNNSFWKDRIGKKIEKNFILQSEYSSPDNPSEFSIELIFENGVKAYFEYLNEEDWPDMLRVVGEYSGPSCKRREVK